MLNKSIKYLIENKFIVFVLLVLILGWGMTHAPFNWNNKLITQDPVPVDAIPDLGENQQIVFSKWEGRSPQDIEDQITYPLTTTLLGIPGVKTIRSSSMFGFSSIYIIFEEDIEFYWSRSRILEKLNALPQGLLPQGVQPSLGPDATALGQLFWYTIEGRDPDGNPTGGWDLDELRSVQDFYVKYALASAQGVSEVSSIGGHIREYQVDVDPKKLEQYNISLAQIAQAIKGSNKDIGAQTIEINRAEYFVRGLGSITSLKDLEQVAVKTTDYRPIYLNEIANIQFGPAQRRGILDKSGVEAVGAAVVSRYGANPLEVIENVKEKIAELSPGLPSKVLADGTESKLTIVPFYDRTELIQETLGTLDEALSLEILITILVIVIMLYNLRASALISGLLPLAVLIVFIAMKYANVDANIVSLSGIAIAIGTMVDVGIILTENIIRRLNEDQNKTPINDLVFNATKEVSSAIITAVLTTIVSFIPVFALIGAEGKLFRPLAFTKTFALIAALLISLFIIPPIAAIIFKKSTQKGIYSRFKQQIKDQINSFYPKSIAGIKLPNPLLLITLALILFLLTALWAPMGVDKNYILNLLIVVLLTFGILGLFKLFQKKYQGILEWALANKLKFLAIPISLLVFGGIIFSNTQKEFMPALDEGSFLLMPSSMPHAGVEQNRETLRQLDLAVAQIPEVATVVGKSGRTESALDPAPLSMYENVINYKSEFVKNQDGELQKFKVNEDGFFVLKDGSLIYNPNIELSEKQQSYASERLFNKINPTELIPDSSGELYRNWRPEIKTANDIWNEIARVSKIPGVTSAPKLQPIETRLVMLQTGMRAPLGIKVRGSSLEQIEAFGFELEKQLKTIKGVKEQTVFADRMVGKPYLIFDLDRDKIARYGLTISKVQESLQLAVGGVPLTQTIEGRERYNIRLRYPRALRNNPDDLNSITIDLPNGSTIPISEVAQINYERGPGQIKSEDGFLVGYVIFDKEEGYAEGSLAQKVEKELNRMIVDGTLKIPSGISYKLTGSYENQLRAEKTLSIIIPLVLLIISVILYMQFRSIATALFIFSGIAVAFSGGFILIWLYGQSWFLNIDLFGVSLREVFNIQSINLSVAVWVGFIALFGIATDDGVVMATYLKQNFEKQKPESITAIRNAVTEAGLKRIKPCLMTTATTLIALLPVMSSHGRGSDIMIPMAIPSFGGMLVALITLFVVPVLYSWNQELKLKKAL